MKQDGKIWTWFMKLLLYRIEKYIEVWFIIVLQISIIKFERNMLLYLVILKSDLIFGLLPAIFCLGSLSRGISEDSQVQCNLWGSEGQVLCSDENYILWGNQWSTSVCSTLPALMVLSSINTWNLTSPSVSGQCVLCSLSSINVKYMARPIIDGASYTFLLGFG